MASKENMLSSLVRSRDRALFELRMTLRWPDWRIDIDLSDDVVAF